MAVVVRYKPSALTKEKYEAGNQRITERAQADAPPGDLLVHVLFGDEGSLLVSEIWSSERIWREAYENLLKPALDEAGIEFESEPEVLPVHELWGAGVPAPTA